ncbi:hypothetical protein ABTY96_35835 [Streptomyces sp. NPDC096057]|uniref:hypothetical protein n=1 Tax=Streptomyces sp. NPDC096057 TaxID=3155543 RepID=UPI00332FBAF0
MSSDEIDTRELYDLMLRAAERLTHPEYTRSLKNAIHWKTAATGLARLVKNLDEALIEGGDIPMEWVIGGLTDDISDDDEDL